IAAAGVTMERPPSGAAPPPTGAAARNRRARNAAEAPLTAEARTEGRKTGQRIPPASGTGAAERPPAAPQAQVLPYSSRSRFFCTLPMVLRGRASTKNARFGTL